MINYENTIKLMVGENVISNLPYTFKQRDCQRIMIVCDEPAYRLGYVDLIKYAFISDPVDIVYAYKGIRDIATTKDVEEIVKQYKFLKCDGIIAIGKKAAIMAAKGAKVLLTEGIRYCNHYRANALTEYPTQNVYLFCVPINFGSGFEALPVARIYDKEANIIYEFNTAYAETNVLVLDTKMTDIIPPKAIATYGLFALSLSLESYLDDDTPMISKAYADTAISTVYRYLQKCILKNANKEYRLKMLEAVGYASCSYAAIGKNNLLSPLSDIISDKYLANYANIYAILFRQYVKTVDVGRAFGYSLNAMVEPNDYALYAKESRAQKALAEIEGLYNKINEYVDFNAKLSDFDVKEEDLEVIADQFSLINEDESITKEDVMQLLKAAF